nr:hypothetical protein [Woeseiaceae bacterium]
LEWLRPLAGSIDDLSVSSDDYHGSGEQHSKPETARSAARHLGIPVNFISVAEPDESSECGDSAVLYRGRAAKLLASRVPPTPWRRFTACPWENLRSPQRVHVDPVGHVHICQGISIGNLLERPLKQIVSEFRPDDHPIVGPLLEGGPAALVDRYGIPHEQGYADHCHLCYESRRALRARFPNELAPDQMYGDA